MLVARALHISSESDVMIAAVRHTALVGCISKNLPATDKCARSTRAFAFLQSHGIVIAAVRHAALVG